MVLAVSHDCDLLVIGSGPAGQKAAIQAAKLRRKVILVERDAHARRGVRQHGHDPVEDDPRGDRLPDRPEPARDLRPGLPAARPDLGRRPSDAYAAGRRARAQRRARPARSQSRDDRRGLRAPPRPAQRRGRRRLGRRAADQRRRDRPRHGLGAGASARTSSSTTRRSSTRTASCASGASPTRSWWSAPASSGSSTHRCSPPSAAR